MFLARRRTNMHCKVSSVWAAQAADLFKDEIVPLETKMKVVNKETGEESIVDTVVDRDDVTVQIQH